LSEIVKANKSTRVRWAGHRTHMGEMKMHTKFWSGSPKGRGKSEDLGIDGKVTLEWILGK
jgi:hypothetical protein